MSFKPAKSRSLVLKKGKTTDKFRLTLGSTQIPSITEKPVKRLGKVSLRHRIHQSHQPGAGSLARGGGLSQDYQASSRPGYTNMASSLGFIGPSLSMRSQYPQSRALREGLAGSYGSGWDYLGA